MKRNPKQKKEIPFEVLMKRFKRTVERSGVLKDLKKYEFYESRGTKRRRKVKEGARRAMRERMKEDLAFQRRH